MICYFPTPYPDELAYSWFCRYLVHSGYLSHKRALEDLYCKRSDNPSKEFIGNLNTEVIHLLEKQYSMNQLVLNHTMFPQYAHFIPLEQKKRALYRLGHETCDPHHLFTVLPRNEGEQYLRFCPLCAQEDQRKYGETYWHRKHQIRNMSICLIHKCCLIESNVTAKSEKGFTFLPAEFHISDCKPVFENNPLLIQFASYLESVFDSPMDFEDDVPISAILYNGMSQTKYLKPSGKIRYTQKLTDDLNRFYQNINVCTIPSIYQIQKVLLGYSFDFSVVCQIAFFLKMKSTEITSPSLTKEQIHREEVSHYMKNTLRVDWKSLDSETAPKLKKLVNEIYTGTADENGRPERISEKMIYRKMGLLSHQLENMPQCRAIFEHYTESYPESWARKVIWAYQELKKQGKTFYWSDIRKLSGVKKKNFQSFLPYLTKHTDSVTAERIIELIGG